MKQNTINPATKTGEKNVQRDKPWESATLNWFNVMQDEGKYRMWYECYDIDSWDCVGCDTSFCYAESKDGITWNKPSLGLVEFEGSKDNNILFRLVGPDGAHSRVHGTGIFKDPTGTETWFVNIASGNLGISVMDGISLHDLRLISNPEGFFTPSDSSPAIDAAKEGYPAIPDIPVLDEDWMIRLDLMQGARPREISLRDAGCTEFPSDMIRPYVDVLNTGPAYLK